MQIRQVSLVLHCSPPPRYGDALREGKVQRDVRQGGRDRQIDSGLKCPIRDRLLVRGDQDRDGSNNSQNRCKECSDSVPGKTHKGTRMPCLTSTHRVIYRVGVVAVVFSLFRSRHWRRSIVG